MKTINSATGPNINALNVVVEAFEKFVNHMKRAILASAVDKNANAALLNVQAHKAYESPNAKYSYHSQKLYNAFYYGFTGKENYEIQNFQTFLKFYRDFLVTLAAKVPVTKSNFILSSRCDIFSTGLSIAIASADGSDDSVKYHQFISDPNFDFFRRCAKKFGFVLDKNAPWVMTADLFTKAFEETGMREYLTDDDGPINMDNFFETFYDKVYLDDFEILITTLINSYKELLRLSPMYDKEIGTVEERCSIVAQPRAPLGVRPSEIIDGSADPNILPSKFLIDLYIDLRHAEANSPVSPAEVGTIKKQAYEVFAVRSRKDLTALQNVADYVNTIYRNYIFGNGAIFLQALNGKRLDNRVGSGKILVEKGVSRQLY